MRTRPLELWSRRHPLSLLAVAIAALGWIVFREIEEIATVRRTVAHGWAAGLAAGVTASLVLAALWTAVLWMDKRAPGKMGSSWSS